MWGEWIIKVLGEGERERVKRIRGGRGKGGVYKGVCRFVQFKYIFSDTNLSRKASYKKSPVCSEIMCYIYNFTQFNLIPIFFFSFKCKSFSSQVRPNEAVLIMTNTIKTT